MATAGRLSLTAIGLFILVEGIRLPILLAVRVGKLRGGGRLHELPTTRLLPRPERVSPRLACFPFPL